MEVKSGVYNHMKTTVKDIYNLLDARAPFSIAQPGDPSGLLVGEMDSLVGKILLALDVTSAVAEEAVAVGAQLVVSHHPVVYHPRKTLSMKDPACILAANGVASIAAHTNLDMAKGGLNDALINLLGWEPTSKFLETIHTRYFSHLITYVPESHEESLRAALYEAGAGRHGNYMDCSFTGEGTRRFLPLEGVNTGLGEDGEPQAVMERRLELSVPPGKEKAVLAALHSAHPYEEPVYKLIENKAAKESYGFGRVCKLSTPTAPEDLAAMIRSTLDCMVVRMNTGGRNIKRAAVCSGGGSNMILEAVAAGADALVSGDARHHDFVEAQNAGITLFDASHYHTEVIALPLLQRWIKTAMPHLEVVLAKEGQLMKYV